MCTLFKNRLGGIALLYLVFIAISFCSRSILLVFSFQEVSTSLWEILKSFSVGLLFDTIAFSYFMIPFLLFAVMLPLKFAKSKLNLGLTYFFYTLAIAVMVYVGFAEFLFWEEFGVRFNFIAVDYLIYTTEVIGNIMESYPIGLLIAAIVIITGGISVLLWKSKVLEKILHSETPITRRLAVAAALLLFPLWAWFFADFQLTEISDNKYNKELSKNGMYAFFEALRNNKIDYSAFYETIDEKEAFSHLRTLMQSDNSSYISDDVLNPVRHTTADTTQPEKKYNVILITVESLSGEYMSYIGNDRDIKMPFLDSLAEQSLFFNNLYANGTRTVRGLEAINLSIPPTPGTSIVRRPNNENLYSLGSVFKEKGYTNKFIYGGFGYFDNMSYFFGNNGFDIIDRNSLSEQEITFANVWGVCDEDMYKRTIVEADAAHKKNEPFFMYMLTTSNHRPYTFPEVGVPFSKDRKGGVAYTDFAFRRFFQMLKGKPWVENTIFVIVADHCGGSAGRSELPILEYKIPMMFYNPKISPQKISKLCSQIDLAPTLLSMLNWNYNSTFYGKNIFTMKPEEERAFIGNYQKLGYIKHDTLTILGPQKSANTYKFVDTTGEETPIAPQPMLHKNAITYYQTAEYMFLKGRNKTK